MYISNLPVGSLFAGSIKNCPPPADGMHKAWRKPISPPLRRSFSIIIGSVNGRGECWCALLKRVTIEIARLPPLHPSSEFDSSGCVWSLAEAGLFMYTKGRTPRLVSCPTKGGTPRPIGSTVQSFEDFRLVALGKQIFLLSLEFYFGF